MSILFSPLSGLSMDLLNPNNQSLPSPSLNSKRKERNKIRKQKYKLKKKQQKGKKKPNQIPITFKPKSTRAWKWKTLKSSFLPNKQKRLLFKVNSLIALKEQNSALIYKLQCDIHTQCYKDRNSVISTSTKSSSSSSSSSSIHSSSNIQNEINLLKDHNTSLQKRIMDIKLSQRTFHSNRISFLKNYHKGHRLRIQLNKANAIYRQFIYLFNSRFNLFFTNVANLMDLDLQLQRTELINKEKDKLSSTNKIHNFTTASLPPETISLLNKGTNFIPTTSTSSTSSLARTVFSEVNTTLCSIIHKKNYQPQIKSSTSRRTSHRFKPYSSLSRPLTLLQQEQTRPNFNLHLIDYVHNTVSYAKEFLQPNNLRSIVNHKFNNITPQTASHITNLQHDNDIILTMTDKNMGWALVPISWFSTEYKRHFSDITTYKRIDNFDISNTVTNSNTLLNKLKRRFSTIIFNHHNQRLLDPTPQDQLHLPYMKLLPKVHKLDKPASHNITELTGRPIITAHSWTTSNPSRLLGTELDNIILQLKDLFKERDIIFPLIYNSMDLLNLLDKLYITDMNDLCFTTFDFTSLYTNITYHDTIHAIITSCQLLNLPIFYRDYLLNLNNFINQRNFFVAGNSTYQQIKGVAMGSYHSRQIADLVLLLSEFSFFNKTNCLANILIFCRYIDDGFMLTNRADLSNIITNLCSSYPSQIPITFTSNHNTTHYLDLTLSFNHFTIMYHKVHYQVYQKPHHKYMYPHFSSNHPQHIFTGIIKTETIRYSRLSATPDDYNFIHKLFSLRLTALNYPDKLISDHSFPWLTLTAHKRRLKDKQTDEQKPTVYYKTLYNKNKRTDKIVTNILRKYHTPNIPNLTKTYCNSTKLHTLLLTNKTLHQKLVIHQNSSTNLI